MNVWINREKIDPDKNLDIYIYTIAKNSALRAIQQQMRYELNDFFHYEETDNKSTDDDLITKEIELLVDLKVSTMPSKRRQVYKMSREEHKDNEEIADELNISRKVVEKHLRLAVKELREIIKIIVFTLFLQM